MSFPVIAEIWQLFEGTLQSKAKLLVEDIARAQGADPKELWKKIKPQIKIGLLDVELPEATICPHSSGMTDGAVKVRCRAPCVLGFEACPQHVGLTVLKDGYSGLELVDRIHDHENHTYFTRTLELAENKATIALDKNGYPKGYMDSEGTLDLFTEDMD